MKILDLKELDNYQYKSIITIGFFDGFHLGHQRIFDTINKEKQNLKSIVITFDDSVLKLFKMTNSINTFNDKINIFGKYNIDYLLVLKASDNFYNLTADEFINQYLDKLNTKIIVGGSDLSFGKNKQGNIKYLKDNTNIDIIDVDDVYIDNIKISSTYIRSLLEKGNIIEANKLLYNDFTINSKIIHGLKIGSSIGFKTANLEITDSCYLLKKGVYFGNIVINNNIYKTMINVGNNPTVNDNDILHVEAYILDFNQDIYDLDVKLIFKYYHRQEIKFENKNQLKEQLNKDLEKLNSVML